MNDCLQDAPQTEQGRPVDLTRDEFTQFNLVLAKTFGTLKMQKIIMLFYAVYLVITIVSVVDMFLSTGKISVVMLLMLLLTVVSAALTIWWMPARTKRASGMTYDAQDINGYYGELIVQGNRIIKDTGDTRVELPLDKSSIYLEHRDFMAFLATQSGQKCIVLPARCMTPDMAKTVREAVFAEGVSINRRVLARMEAKANVPIPRQTFPPKPSTLCVADVVYEPQEFMRLHSDITWKKYVQSLPGFALTAALIGAMLAVFEENVPAFFVITLGLILGYLLISMVSGRAQAKRSITQELRLRVALTDRGIDMKFSPSGRETQVLWKSVERAVERPDSVEFFYCGKRLLRIPKRCIDDMDTLCYVVDEHMKT